MTMTRDDLNKHRAVLATIDADGFVAERFASPIKIRAAIADRGHDRMTVSEYAALRMGRDRMCEYRLDVTCEHRAARLVGRRVYGNGRLQTGQAIRLMREHDADVRRDLRRR